MTNDDLPESLRDPLKLMALYDAKQARDAAERESASDRVCQESDGCPTEMAVLKRFWRAHQKPKRLAWHRRLWCALGDHGGITSNHYCKRCGAKVKL